jgi:hypothetical protein
MCQELMSREISFHSAGAPHHNLSKGIEDKHCVKVGCSDESVTGSFGVRTNPRKEYEIVTGRRACPAEDMLDKKGRTVRVVKRIEELKLLQIAQKAGLSEDEILAVVRTCCKSACAFEFLLSPELLHLSDPCVQAGAVHRTHV